MKTPPQNLDVEQSVLGCLLTDKEAVFTALEILTPADFYRDSHRLIFESIIELSENNQPIDLLTVTDELKQNNKLDAVGGISYVAGLTNTIPTITNIEKYCEIVMDKSLKRQAINEYSRALSLLYEENDDVKEVITNTNLDTDKIISRGHKEIKSHKELLPQALETIEKRKANNGILGIPTGIKNLDVMTAGQHPGELIILAARPSMGKSDFALHLAKRAAVVGNIYFASLEMSKESLTERLLVSESMVDRQIVKLGKLQDEDWLKLTNGASRVYSRNHIKIDDTFDLTPTEIKARARKMQREIGLSMIIIDYLQLMSLGTKTENRVQEVSAISRKLKGIARELNVPVIALSQLSRAVEQRQDKRPMMSDLRESGAIEQDADTILFLYRDEYYNPNSDKKGITEIIIGKQRNGPVGKVEAVYLKDIGSFANPY